MRRRREVGLRGIVGVLVGIYRMRCVWLGEMEEREEGKTDLSPQNSVIVPGEMWPARN